MAKKPVRTPPKTDESEPVKRRPIPRKGSVTADEVADGITKFTGNLAAVADFLGCSRSTVYRRVHHDDNPWLRDHLDDERERNLDELESELYTQAKNGNIAALIFALKTQGYKRGYQETRKVQLDADLTVKERTKRKKEDADYLKGVLAELDELTGDEEEDKEEK